MAIAFTYDESTNIVAVTGGTSGTPATFADFVTADRAGTAELTPEDAPASCAFNMTLTEQIRPVEDLALQISFILAGTSAGTTQEWTAASVNVTANAIIAGSVTDTYTDNGTHLQIDESVGAAPCLDFDFTWSGLPTNYYPEKVTLNGYYDGNPAHDVFIYMWNYDTTAWDRLTADAQDFPDAAADDDYEFDVPTVDTENYFDSGAAKVRINHTSNGTAGHDFYVDQILLTRPATNNTLDITGTDWDGNAQSESIDVSGGDDTYNGAYKWRTITDIDCNGWPDGTLKVTQPQWGVIWDLGNGMHRLACSKWNIGNGSDSTYFADTLKLITLDDNMVGNWQPWMTVTNSATAVFGNATDESLKHTDQGCSFIIHEADLNHYTFVVNATGTLYFYSCSISETSSSRRGFVQNSSGGTCRIWNCMYTYYTAQHTSGANTDIFNLTIQKSYYGMYTFSGTAEDIRIQECTLPILLGVGSGTFDNMIMDSSGVYGFNPSGCTGTNYIDDTTSNNWAPNWTGELKTGEYIRRYSCNIHVVDKDGTALQSVVVDCEDTNTDAAWTAGTITTDVSGDITEQKIEYQRYYFNVTAQTTTYSPHKFTLSKAGYETLILDNITVDAPIVWHLELQPMRARVLGRPSRRISAPNFQQELI